VARPALTVRAPTGYYNEPVYFDNPRPGIEKVTVAQLEELAHSQTDLLRKLAKLELTERLSTPRLDALLAAIHGERERQALTADADLSLALAPPADEIVNRPPPPMEEQRAIIRRTFDYLQNAIPKLPDFYALRPRCASKSPRNAIARSGKCRTRTRLSILAPRSTLLFSIETGARWLSKRRNLANALSSAGCEHVILKYRARSVPFLPMC
jgi:hypothetical protein